MRRLSFVIPLVLLVVALGLGLVVPGVTQAADVSVVTAVDLNLRAGPGFDYDVLWVVPVGEAVALTGDPLEGWYPVMYGDIEGWVSGDGLAFDDSDAPSSSEAMVVVAGANLRGDPGLDADVLVVLPYGTVVQVVGDLVEADGYSWLPVEVEDVGSGWIAAALLDADESLALLP